MSVHVRSIEEQIIMHEGLRLKPYRCPAGYLTIGVGRNLDTKGLSKEEALFLLGNDITEIVEVLEKYSWYINSDAVRRKVLIDMAFNLGITGLLKFLRMIAALERKDYAVAAKEMENSRWYRQVGERGRRLVEMMRPRKDYKT